MHYREKILSYAAQNEQEQRDQQLIAQMFRQFGDELLNRSCLAAHLTSSGLIVNPERTKTLMVYHNIYQSWSWTGGHADGQKDLLAVALREAMEETGITSIRPLSNEIASLDVLTVPGHRKNGHYVSAHLHLSVAYLLEAPEGQELRVCEGENSGVMWIPLKEIADYSSEPDMCVLYEKLVQRVRLLSCN